ncbi:MAG TPA: aspartate-semialdehyde dehydrogenase [Clostridiaceae bacterium]|nr:aspartate-semialdehyde dehydrogenase [Clostridiaceae bacterium]
MSGKFKVGVIGGTGFVGQRFVTLLENHPWFEVVCVAASERSAGKTYAEAVEGRWKLNVQMPSSLKDLVVKNINQVDEITEQVDFVFCAVDMEKDKIKAFEEMYAKKETPVVSNNSAHRWTPDVPMVIPEINPEHLEIIEKQKQRLGTKRGFIAVKPNCSIQSYVPAIHPLMSYNPQKILVSTYQAISGAGKVFKDWPEMEDNIIPYIGGEEDKSENEPLKIWGHIEGNEIVKADRPVISAQCYRVPVSDGHLASVAVSFEKKPSKEEIFSAWNSFKGKPQVLDLPSAPKQFLKYFEEENRPQTKLDRDYENGMGVTIGRLREDSIFDYKFACLSHNTIRGAAGGAILIAELLVAEGYIEKK